MVNAPSPGTHALIRSAFGLWLVGQTLSVHAVRGGDSRGLEIGAAVIGVGLGALLATGWQARWVAIVLLLFGIAGWIGGDLPLRPETLAAGCVLTSFALSSGGVAPCPSRAGRWRAQGQVMVAWGGLGATVAWAGFEIARCGHASNGGPVLLGGFIFAALVVGGLGWASKEIRAWAWVVFGLAGVTFGWVFGGSAWLLVLTFDPAWLPPRTAQRPVLLFDGACGLCTTVVRFLIREDAGGGLRFATLQGIYGQSALRRCGLPTTTFDSLVYCRTRMAGNRDCVPMVYWRC